MSYTKSGAGIGLGSVLAIGDGASPEVFTTVGELKSLQQSGRIAQTVPVTNFQSTQTEVITTLVDEGTWDFQGSKVGAESGQVKMEAAFYGLALHNFTIQLPKSGAEVSVGDKFAFAAYVVELNYGMTTEGIVTIAGKLKVSGHSTFTVGS